MGFALGATAPGLLAHARNPHKGRTNRHNRLDTPLANGHPDSPRPGGGEGRAAAIAHARLPRRRTAPAPPLRLRRAARRPGGGGGTVAPGSGPPAFSARARRGEMAALIPAAASSPAGAPSRSKKRPASPGTGSGPAKKKKATGPSASQVTGAGRPARVRRDHLPPPPRLRMLAGGGVTAARVRLGKAVGAWLGAGRTVQYRVSGTVCPVPCVPLWGLWPLSCSGRAVFSRRACRASSAVPPVAVLEAAGALPLSRGLRWPSSRQFVSRPLSARVSGRFFHPPVAWRLCPLGIKN